MIYKKKTCRTGRIRRVLLCTAFLILHSSFFTPALAQTDPEYRMEVGGGIGLMSYQGDFNGNILKNQQPAFTVLAKYKFNPRVATAMNVTYGSIKGKATDDASHTPEQWKDYAFSHSMVDVGLRMEYNFWPYGTGFDYRGAKRLTPYIFLGLGVSVAKPKATEMALNLPIGGGMKYKAADRLNIALEWAMHIGSNDWMDGVGDPYGVKSSGLFKNTDCYSHLRLSLSYDLWAKCRTCHKE